eukprot:CAMPEP_0113477118 /NCGR_PEP_ID=MMETSP0014_2-20120614/20035_1 /TAXON_ID=2857 /ORGANISM="Nitzschia sp." /LENGTH=170 /DNA_ID=CAMNT_0000370187 /DNA_START=126 /DNA_END=638 /DNA_ORIENTATION=- /assembly_acc=CAM_ASM_000159
MSTATSTAASKVALSSSAFAGNEPALVRKVLTSSKTIAVVGASSKPERPSNYVTKYLMDRGYTVIPVNPGLEGQTIHGQKVYPTLTSIVADKGDRSVDMVDIFRASDACPSIVEEAIQIDAKSVWMQLGIINEEAYKKAQAAGLDVIMDACPKIEIPKLGIEAGPSSSSL